MRNSRTCYVERGRMAESKQPERVRLAHAVSSPRATTDFRVPHPALLLRWVGKPVMLCVTLALVMLSEAAWPSRNSPNESVSQMQFRVLGPQLIFGCPT